MNLKKEIPIPEDKLEYIHVPVTKFVTIDLNKTIEDYQEELCDQRQRFGSEQFLAMATQADERVTIAETRAETERTKRTEEAIRTHILQNQPFDRYVRAWKNRNTDITQLSDFLKTEPMQTLRTLADQLESNPRHFASLFQNQIGTAIFTLRQTINARTAEETPPEAAVTFWLKAKKLLGIP